jgi:hypothetical protein
MDEAERQFARRIFSQEQAQNTNNEDYNHRLLKSLFGRFLSRNPAIARQLLPGIKGTSSGDTFLKFQIDSLSSTIASNLMRLPPDRITQLMQIAQMTCGNNAMICFLQELSKRQ